MKDATRLIRAVFPEAGQGRPFLPGPTFAGTYHLAGDPATSAYTYGRFHNPTWTAYEQAITDLERASATIVFSSGMAAVAALMGVMLKTGDVLVMPAEGYYAARTIASGFFTSLGATVRTAPTANDAQLEQIKGAKLLWIETPTNPGLDVCDIARLTEAAHAAGALVVVDNTTPSCLGQQPVALGADFSLSSDTKITTGHSDVLLGHISVRDTALGDQLRAWRTQMGSTPGPMEVWLAHRSLATLHLRLERQSANALRIAECLASHPNVRGVRYPGLKTHPGHQVASRQMAFFGPVVSFELPDRDFAARFLSACQHTFEATSFGGVHTTAERRARWGGDAVPDGFIRMSAGCEDADDLVADLREALGRAKSPSA